MSTMVATPRPSSPMIHPVASWNSTSDDALERLPSLSFRRWKWRALTVPSGRKRGSKKSESPPGACAQNQKGIRHRSGHEPFVSGDRVEAIRGAHGLRRVRANIRAALLFRHAHANHDSGFVGGGFEALVEERDSTSGSQSRAKKVSLFSKTGTAALVIVRGQQWPDSICTARKSFAARTTWGDFSGVPPAGPRWAHTELDRPSAQERRIRS